MKTYATHHKLKLYCVIVSTLTLLLLLLQIFAGVHR